MEVYKNRDYYIPIETSDGITLYYSSLRLVFWCQTVKDAVKDEFDSLSLPFTSDAVSNFFWFMDTETVRYSNKENIIDICLVADYLNYGMEQKDEFIGKLTEFLEAIDEKYDNVYTYLEYFIQARLNKIPFNEENLSKIITQRLNVNNSLDWIDVASLLHEDNDLLTIFNQKYLEYFKRDI